MVELPYDACARSMALLNQYSFDLGDQTTEQVIIDWLTEYQPKWIELAVIEALYQGRYKAFSVRKILSLWQRRGKPAYHFTLEFEVLVCQDVVQNYSSNHRLEEEESLIDDLNNPSQSNVNSEDSVDDIVLRPIQAIVVPIQYPDFFGKLKAFVAMDSDFLTGSDPEVDPVNVIDVSTIEAAKIIEIDD